MSGRLLDFKSYVGGADNVVVEDIFPSTVKTYTYDYGTDVTNYDTASETPNVFMVETLAYLTLQIQKL